ncbi:MAG: hypothetical protein IJL88_12875 [Clostridia bacterium]|nr:hypothetical protein [Clostridia bacterium]
MQGLFEETIRELYRITTELEEKYPGRHFTPDGHMLGSIGEVYAAETYHLQLLTAGTSIHDAKTSDGKLVQIKITQTEKVALSSEPRYLIVLKMHRDGSIEEIYNGRGDKPWKCAGKMQKNGQCPISLKKLMLLNKEVLPQDVIG